MVEAETSLSARSLALLFLLGVVVCAGFFSFGFLLGYKERSSGNTAEVERVAPTGDTPPVVNPLPEKQETNLRQAATPPAAVPTAQPAAVESGQKGVNAASDTKASAQDASSGPTRDTTSSAGKQSSPEAEVPAPTEKSKASGMVLQVAALQAKQDAEALVKILKQRSYPVFLVTPEEAHTNDNLFRVQVGPFTSREEEEKTRRKLETEGFRPFVKR